MPFMQVIKSFTARENDELSLRVGQKVAIELRGKRVTKGQVRNSLVAERASVVTLDQLVPYQNFYYAGLFCAIIVAVNF